MTGSGETNMVFPFDKSEGLAAAAGKIDGSRNLLKYVPVFG
jgi:hypothetical protein